MGCDIHWVLERKHEQGWIGVTCSLYSCNDLASNRSYQFFAELGMEGRSESDEAEQLKGFPVDASQLSSTQYAQWGVDAHSASHLSANDFIAAKHRAATKVAGHSQKLDRKDIFNAWLWDDELDEHRVVFWFDN